MAEEGDIADLSGERCLSEVADTNVELTGVCSLDDRKTPNVVPESWDVQETER